MPSEGGVDDGSASAVAEVWPEEVACAVWVGADSGSLAEEQRSPGDDHEGEHGSEQSRHGVKVRRDVTRSDLTAR